MSKGVKSDKGDKGEFRKNKIPLKNNKEKQIDTTEKEEETKISPEKLSLLLWIQTFLRHLSVTMR